MIPLRDRTTWIYGDRFGCLQLPKPTGRPWRLVLLGPPGVGKGTQARMLSEDLGACPLSTGEVFRSAHDRSLAPGSPLAEAGERVNRGELVPDDVVLGLIQDRRSCLRCPGGFILHGFPRTELQAAALDALLAGERLQLDAVISYDLPLSDLAARLAGRIVCHECHLPYHVATRVPKRDGICDHCGAALTQRTDDTPAAIEARLKLHAEAMGRVFDYYKRQGLLLEVDAREPPDVIFTNTVRVLAMRGLRLHGIEPDLPAG